LKKDQRKFECTGCGSTFFTSPSRRRGGLTFCSHACRANPLRHVSKGHPKGCWIWTAYKNKKGYGKTGRKTSTERYAHRFMYETFVGPIPAGLHIDHLCKNPSCVNPKHLEPVTPRENLIRGDRIQNARKANHCRHGHKWTPKNTYTHPTSGSRICRICTLESIRRYQKRKSNV
jgi:hypothetical protein